MTYVYHERQLASLCGVHCVNNLLQGPRFGPGDFAEIGVRFDRREKRLLGNRAATTENCDAGADGGNFSIQVLRVALARAGFKVVPAMHPDGQEMLQRDPARAVGAYLVQQRGHWLALRATDICWWDLDSLLPEPKPLEETVLTQRVWELLCDEGNLFLVCGGTLPAPLPPQGAVLKVGGDRGDCQKQSESNWYDAMALLSKLDAACSIGNSAVAVSSSTCASQHASTSLGLRKKQNTNIVNEGTSCLDAFTESEVRAALALSGGNNSLAAALLCRARGHRRVAKVLGKRQPVLLARALSSAVSSVLEAKRTLPERIARLVVLLCAPGGDHVRAAADLVDCGDLANQLLTALAKKSRGFIWTQGMAQAATVAVELLLALPAQKSAEGSCKQIRSSSSSSSSASGVPSEEESINVGCGIQASRSPPNAENDVNISVWVLDAVGIEGQLRGQPTISDPGLRSHVSSRSMKLQRGNSVKRLAASSAKS
eukprot:CAMPEP_0172812828 /NCGR_PEP_ID=MMETSP1075-20121228/10278_1 /TAXON_ID=2916 /ORGANISM="Ceratium fusus, Strain PA161109" /LENGTH=484 /DNA_ID=CAMNT_0013652427 /DNA_START=44 /DNA_END=1495 /DNA_ORIENTATION=+